MFSELVKLKDITNSMYGRHHSDEAKEKMRIAHLGKPAWNKGIPLSYETKQKLSASLKGRKSPTEGTHRTEETKRKISLAKKGRSIQLPPRTKEHQQKINRALKGRVPWNIGKAWPTETKQKISQALSGERSFAYGKHPKPETIQKMSIARKKNNPMKNPEVSCKVAGKRNGMYGVHGKDHPSWIDGRSFLPYCSKFNTELKEQIRNRDNRTCQFPSCGAKETGTGVRHAVHHVHYDKKNCAPDLITLCNRCNSKVNTNRDYWEEYFTNLLRQRGLL